MMRSVEGIYKSGKVVLLEQPDGDQPMRVIVTFLDARPIDLAERGIGEAQAAELRGRLKSIADDWDRAEMDVYDAI